MALLLTDVARNVEVIPDRTTVHPGDLLAAHLSIPLPPDSPALGADAFTVEVRWHVTDQAPAVVGGFVPIANPYPGEVTPNVDFIAPGGLNQLNSFFGLMPPFSSANATPAKPYWLIAEFSLRRPGTAADDAAGLLQVTRARASGPIDALGLSANDIVDRVVGLFKIEMLAAPVEPGAPIIAKLRPKGAEDAEWDVQSASDIVPKYDLAAKVQLDPLFKPLGRIIGGVFGVTNQILGAGTRLFTPLVRVIQAVGKGLLAVANALSFGRAKNPLAGMNVLREVDKLLRRLRIKDVDLFKGLELPIDANLVNRNFTTNLVPKDSVAPLPGPRGLLPTIPSLESQLELMDRLPDAASVVPVVGDLSIPLSIADVVWELWRTPDLTLGTQLLPDVDYYTVQNTAGLRFKRTLAVEPPLGTDATVYLVVRVLYRVDPAGAAFDQTVLLPAVPIRLVAFNPLTFIAQQFELGVPTEPVEFGQEIQVEMLSPLLSQLRVTPSGFDLAFPLGALPVRSLSVQIALQVMDEAKVPLAEGTDYAIGGSTALLKSLLLIPAASVLRRENPAPITRYVTASLRTFVPALEASIGPVPVLAVPLQLPLFAAGIVSRPLPAPPQGQTSAPGTIVVLPSFYTTQAPSWVDSWETFSTRLRETKERVEALLALAGGSAATPLSAGSSQRLGDATVRRLTLLRGALDLVADRSDNGKLLFGTRPPNPAVYGDYRGSVLESCPTIIVFNDAETILTISRYEQASFDLSVPTTAARPICVLRRETGYLGIQRYRAIPRQPEWPAGEDIVVATTGGWFLRFAAAGFRFDQQLPINDFFPTPAALLAAAD